MLLLDNELLLLLLLLLSSEEEESPPSSLSSRVGGRERWNNRGRAIFSYLVHNKFMLRVWLFVIGVCIDMLDVVEVLDEHKL
jgi:hypothetical protein